MPSKKIVKPKTDAELDIWESTRGVEAELIESVRQMAAGTTSLAYSPAIAARQASGLGARSPIAHTGRQNADCDCPEKS